TWGSRVPDSITAETKFLQNMWDGGEAARLAGDPLSLLRYRSNLLGADLRITNFGGGNTSSKFELADPLTGEPVRVMAVKANGGEELDEFNSRYGRHIAWVPWQRPGFELALMLRKAVADHPGCDGIVLGSHGLFTWGDSGRDCYVNSVKTIDQMGEFVDDHVRSRRTAPFGG